MKKFTKRLLCLALALTLCAVMMLPGFAAVAPNQTNHTHVWNATGPAVPYKYEYYDPQYHITTYRTPRSCECQATSYWENTRYEPHSTRPYCNTCNHRSPGALGEVMESEYEYIG